MKQKFINSIISSLGNKSLGTSMYNIYDYKFNIKICINDIPYPMSTQVKYYYNHPINLKKEKRFLTIIGKDDQNFIEIKRNDLISFIINVREKENCKEQNIMNSKNTFKITQFDLPNNNQIISYIKMHNNTYICICKKNSKFYIYSIEHKIDKSIIERIFLPYLGENIINPLFKIKSWETEITINNKIIVDSIKQVNFFSGFCNHNKCNYLYLTCGKNSVITNNSKIKYKIFFILNNQKHLIKNSSFIFLKEKLLTNNKCSYFKNNKDIFELVNIDSDNFYIHFGIIKIKTAKILNHINLSI